MRKALVCFLLGLACTAYAETFTERVDGVADGDTITVLDADKLQHKIRLDGIESRNVLKSVEKLDWLTQAA